MGTQSPVRDKQFVIAKLGLDALRTADPAAFVEHCVEEAASTVGAKYGAYMELHGTDHILALGLTGWSNNHVRNIEAIDKCGQLAYALQTRETVTVSDYREEKRFVSHPIIEKMGLRSGMTVIAWDGDKPIGIFAVQDPEPGKFNESDADFLQAVTNILASVMIRERALKELAEREERFRTFCDTVPIVVWSSDVEGRIDFSTRKCTSTRTCQWQKCPSVGLSFYIPMISRTSKNSGELACEPVNRSSWNIVGAET